LIDHIDPREFGEGDLRSIMQFAANIMSTQLHSYFHQFDPWGLTGIVVVEDSHLSVHTWPEYGIINLDIFTCAREKDAEEAIKFLLQQFSPQRVEWKKVYRGSQQLE
jgi:S-adenosylmethionine decarboxylase